MLSFYHVVDLTAFQRDPGQAPVNSYHYSGGGYSTSKRGGAHHHPNRHRWDDNYNNRVESRFSPKMHMPPGMTRAGDNKIYRHALQISAAQLMERLDPKV